MQDLKVTFPEPCSERWDDMRPKGCNRFCDRCSTTIHDLSKLSAGDIETLLESGEKICVKAEIDPSGKVSTRPTQSSRKIIATVGLSVALLAQPAQLAAAERKPTGSIEGDVHGIWDADVVATNTDGRVFTTKAKDGRYKLKRLPAGTYSVEFRGTCGDDNVLTWSGGAVFVRAYRSTLLNSGGPEQCQEIIVGLISRDDGTRAE